MATEIKVPTLGESVTTATVARWMKQPGEAVAADEPLVELETDKVTVEVGAPAAGTLGEIVVAAGGEVGVGAVLGLVVDGAAAPVPANVHPNPAANPRPGVNVPPSSPVFVSPLRTRYRMKNTGIWMRSGRQEDRGLIPFSL